MSIWFFHGKEEFLISKEVEKLKSQLLDEAFKSMNFRIYYSPNLEELLEICATAPLMFGNIVSLVHCESYFFKIKNKKIDFSDEQIKAIEYALQNVSDSNTIIFVCNIPRNDDKKIPATSKIFKLFAKYSNIKDFPQFRDFDKNFIPFVNSMLKEKDLAADTKTVNYLVKHLGVNLRLIDSELEKIKTAIYPNKKFTQKEVDDYCTLTEDVFALADLMVENDKNSILKQFSAVIEKRHPLEVIALLHTNLHKLLYLKTYEREKSTKAMSLDLGIPEYPVKLLQEKIKGKTLSELLALKHNLTDAEFKIKTGKTQNPEYLLESVLLTGGRNV